MLTFFLDNALLLFGFFVIIHGTYDLIHGRREFKNFLWLFAGIITVAVIILDHTIFFDLISSGHDQMAHYLKNFGNGLIFFLYVYIGYSEWKPR